MNYASQALQPHEITSMQSNTEIMERITKSYEMMLDFYGMRLVSAEIGLLDRSEDFSDRYENLSCRCSRPGLNRCSSTDLSKILDTIIFVYPAF